MKQRFTSLSLAAALLAVAGIAGTAVAQDTDSTPIVPRFERLLPKLTQDAGTPATPLTTWNGTFSYLGKTYNYNMVGTAPSTGTSTTIPTFIIPIVLKFTKNGKTTTFSPLTKLSNGRTVVQNTEESPIFKKMDWVTKGGTNLGTTQYEDAFQRGNFWNVGGSSASYHVLLGTPKVLPVQTLTVPAADGSVQNDFGFSAGNADITWLDGQLQTIMKKLTQIQPNTLPIFIVYDTYLTSGGCCIGGYHSSFGSSSALQAYSEFTYADHPGVFSQDVSALSHEIGEYIDDPLVVNVGGNVIDSKCAQVNGSDILEVGDPEEVFAGYGDFPYTLNGFTYNLQDLVYIGYFGAPTTTSVDNGTFSFQDNPFNLTVCSSGG